MTNTDYAAGHRAGAAEMREACANAIRAWNDDDNDWRPVYGIVEALPLPAPTDPVTRDDTLLAALLSAAERACESWPKRSDDYYRPYHEDAMEELKRAVVALRGETK